MSAQETEERQDTGPGFPLARRSVDGLAILLAESRERREREARAAAAAAVPAADRVPQAGRSRARSGARIFVPRLLRVPLAVVAAKLASLGLASKMALALTAAAAAVGGAVATDVPQRVTEAISGPPAAVQDGTVDAARLRSGPGGERDGGATPGDAGAGDEQPVEEVPQGPPDGRPQGPPDDVPGRDGAPPAGPPEDVPGRGTPQDVPGPVDGPPQAVPAPVDPPPPSADPPSADPPDAGGPVPPPRGKPEGTPDGPPEGAPQGPSDTPPAGAPEGVPGGKPEGTPGG